MGKDMSKIKEYLSEEKLNFETCGDQGDKTLKCPSCEMDNFVHAGGVCELDIWKKLIKE